MMNRKIFNGKLCVDVLKQLRKAGFVMLIVTLVISVTPILIAYFNSTRHGAAIGIPSAISVAPVLIPFMYLGAMGLVFSVFSFLNKRDSSDFYHALPNTRLCTYVSLLVPAIIWLLGIIVANIAAIGATYALCGLPFNYAYIPYLLLSYGVGALLVAACAAIAVSISGTRFTNIILTGILVFLPRLVLLVFQMLLSKASVIVPTSEFGWFMSPQINLAFGMFFGMSGNEQGVVLNLGAIIYSFVLGLVYFVLGYFLFNRRKSELAGMSAPGRGWQTLYRCLITLPVFLVGLLVTFGGIYEIEIVVALVIASLIVYFVYELITTKKLKNLVRSIPAYFGLYIVCAILALIASLWGTALKGHLPDYDTITAMSLPRYELRDNYYTYALDPSYTQLLLDDVKIQDDTATRIVWEGLNDTIKGGNGQSAAMEGQAYTFHLKSGATFSRYIGLNPKQAQELNTILYGKEDVVKVLEKLPGDDEIGSIHGGLSEASANKQLWQQFKEEYKTLSHLDMADMQYFMQGFSLPKAQDDDAQKQFRAYGNISIIGSVGTKNYRSTYTITNKTPKTASLYYNLYNKEMEKSYQNWRQNLLEKNDFSFGVWMNSAELSVGADYFIYPGHNSTEQNQITTKELADFLDWLELKKTEITMDADSVLVDITVHEYTDGKSSGRRFQLAQEDMEVVTQFIAKMETARY